MYPKLGAIPTPTGQQGESGEADVEVQSEYGDEGQKQNHICKMGKCSWSKTTVGISVVLIISSIVGAGFMHRYLTNRASPEQVPTNVETKQIRWTLENLNISKPIFSVDYSRWGIDEATPMFVQWHGDHLKYPNIALFQAVFRPNDSYPNDFYLYDLSDLVDILGETQDLSGRRNSVDASSSNYVYVDFGEDLVMNRDGWELPLECAAKYDAWLQRNHLGGDTAPYKVRFKSVVRQNGKVVNERRPIFSTENDDESDPVPKAVNEWKALEFVFKRNQRTEALFEIIDQYESTTDAVENENDGCCTNTHLERSRGFGTYTQEATHAEIVIDAEKKIVILCVYGLKDDDILDLSYLPKHLTSLDLRAGRLTSIDWSKLPRRLDIVNLAENKIGKMTVDDAPTSLKILRLVGNPLEKKGITFVLPLPRRMKLEISNIASVNRDDARSFFRTDNWENTWADTWIADWADGTRLKIVEQQIKRAHP